MPVPPRPTWPRLGAVPRDGDQVDVHVWAPNAAAVAVRVNGEAHGLSGLGDGLFGGAVAARAGDDYVFLLDGAALPDPCSRDQPAGVQGPSRIVDTRTFPWSETSFGGLALEELVIYELHVGAFSERGTFAGVAERLGELRELGVTAIELMPVATFPGERNWGYDGLYAFAPHRVYGGPPGLAHLVDAAHRHGLGVILDVVYNHLGPGSDAIGAFGPYFTDTATTFWGDAIDYAVRGPREWAIQNAEMWVREYHVDGLRLDATHAIHDDSRPHVLAELAERVRAINPRVLVISEAETGDLRPLEAWGHDAEWADEFHHALHVVLTGERAGYYARYDRSLEALGRQILRTPAPPLVFCSQNHDQVGNRPLGDRPALDELRLRAGALLFAPQTPLLFMGEEYGERQPFQFFTDHIDPDIAEATREGRRREVGDLVAGQGRQFPDPQDPATFERSKLRPEAGDPSLLALYGRLLALRRELAPRAEVAADDATGLLSIRRGTRTLLLNFSARTRSGIPPRDLALR